MVSSVPQTNFEDVAAASKSAKTAASSVSTANKLLGGSTLEANYDIFLKLLTTQLKNQNPLEPMGVEKFTEQLTQFSNTSELIKIGSQLSDLNTQSKASAALNAVNFMGTEVTATGNIAELKDGNALWNLNSPSNSVLTAKVSIKNAAGQEVFSDNYTLNPGAQAYVWNGKGPNGISLPNGKYTVSIDAKDASGGVVQVITSTKGKVTGIDLSQGEAVLLIGNARVKLSDVTAISSTATP